MYTPGKLFYIYNFEFDSDQQDKNKYLLILKQVGEDIIVASLPTSVNSFPYSRVPDHGCTNMPDINLDCYHFKHDVRVTTCGWCFPRNTYVYPYRIDEYSTANLSRRYPVQGRHFEVIGELTDDEFEALLDCFRKSGSIKRKYKRMFS